MWVMRDSNVANAAKESAHDEFPHGLQDLCTVPMGRLVDGRAIVADVPGFKKFSV
jgi:hypothetical protein